MKQFGILVLTIFCLAPVELTGPADAALLPDQTIPKVMVSLPQGTDSSKVAITYFMSGPFGGYGNSMQQLPGLSAYSFDAGINGAKAADIKIVAYAPGCSFGLFDLPVRGETDIKVLYACNALGTVPFTGKISPTKAFHGKDVFVDVVYHSNISDTFFRTADGLVTLIPVVTAIPDNNGVFSVQLPDFLSDAANKTYPLQNTSFRFTLRDKKTLNVIATLSINHPKIKNDELPLAASYPNPTPIVAADLN